MTPFWAVIVTTERLEHEVAFLSPEGKELSFIYNKLVYFYIYK